MSEHAPPPTAAAEPGTRQTGLKAFQSGEEFNGPVEDLEGHHCNDHFAQIYETDAERFAAAVPFVRHGLQQGERVIYVVEKHREAEVRTALRDGNIDVDSVLDAGMLSFHTAEETYLRNDSFDPDDMIEFYADTVAEATAEDNGLRIVAETTWLDGNAISYEAFMEYEAKINQLFDVENCLALCQYDRDGFPPEFVQNIVQSHPHLIYDGAVCHNVYYTPPAEVFDDDPAREVDRMLDTLRDRTAAKAELQQRDRFLRNLYAIVADQTQSFDEKLDALFDLGCEQFDLDFGFLNRVDPDDDYLEIEYASGEHDHYEPGSELPLSETYCRAAVDIEAAASIVDPVAEGYDDLLVYEDFGVDGYLGTYIPVDGGTDRTLAFVPAADSQSVSVSAQDRMYLELMGQWVGYELNRRRREQFLRECYELTSDPDKSFEEKLHGLFELGCEQFDLDIGGLAKVDPETDLFEVEYVEGDHGYFEPGARADLSETYCRLVTDDGETAAVTDPVDAGFESDECYRKFGVQSYLGTRLEIDGDDDRTFWFVSTEPHDNPVTDEERTFVHLMGQWVKYELERRQHEQELERTKTRFETVFEQSNDGIFLIDPEEDAIVDANPVAAEMTGYTRDELVTLSPSDLHPDELEPFHAFLEEVREAGSAWSEDLHCRHRDGRDLPVEMSASAITLDGRELVLANVRHIEERKKHERYQRDLYEITAASDLQFEEKLERLLELGRERFGVEMGGLNHLPSWDGPFRLEKGVGLGSDGDGDLWTDPSMGCFCRHTIEQEAPVSMPDVRGTDWAEDTIHQEVGLTSYLGTSVTSGSTPYGTLWFGSTEPRDRPFSESERTFIELMSQWVSYELERREQKQDQQKLYRITADPDLTTDEKIAELLELGCEHLDLPIGMLTRKRNEAFEITHMHGDHPELNEGSLTPPLTDNYCSRVVETGLSATVADAEEAGWDGDALYHEFGLECYAGVQLTVDDEPYGTICFTDLSPRNVEFTEAEQTFLELMGQCVSYELDRNQRESQLEQKNDRLESFASMLAHELRNPVAIGQIYSQQLPAEADAEAVNYVTEAFDRIEDMIDVMLVLTRGREAIGEQSLIELSDKAREAWTDLDTPDAALDIEMDQTIQADETYIRHLFRNLLENAVEHGGSDVTITVGELSDGFYVADDGDGIPPEERERVFDEGYTTAADNGGTGLGLAFVEKLAKVYEWDLAVTDSAAGGARFEFRNVI